MADEAVLKCADVLDAAVVRPGTVFGGGAGLTKELVWPLVEGRRSGKDEACVPVKESLDYPLVHREDLAEFVLRLVENVALPSLG